MYLWFYRLKGGEDHCAKMSLDIRDELNKVWQGTGRPELL